MCIIATTPSKSLITIEEFDRMWRRNPDGAGFAWVELGELQQVKGLMTLTEARKAWDAIPNDAPVLAHFRIATHGAIVPELTHPFPLGRGICMAHNGIFTLKGAPTRQCNSSDTSLVAEIAAEAIRLHAAKFSIPAKVARAKEAIKPHLGGSKVVILDRTGAFSYLGKERGETDGHRWFSNSGFKKSIQTTWDYHGSQYTGTGRHRFTRDLEPVQELRERLRNNFADLYDLIDSLEWGTTMRDATYSEKAKSLLRGMDRVQSDNWSKCQR